MPIRESPRDSSLSLGEGLTAEGMNKCVWVRPGLVAQIEFLGWTESDRLRHAKLVGLREEKNPRNVVKEQVTKFQT